MEREDKFYDLHVELGTDCDSRLLYMLLQDLEGRMLGLFVDWSLGKGEEAGPDLGRWKKRMLFGFLSQEGSKQQGWMSRSIW
jgi:hypothetical protein